MRSLTLKLTIAFLVVSVLGAGLVALLVGWQTQSQFDQYVYHLYHDDLVGLADQLASRYQQYGNWDGISAVVIRDQSGPAGRRGDHWLPVTLIDAERTVVYGGWQYESGQQLSRGVVKQGVPITVDGQVVGWVVLDSLAGRGHPRPESPESSFLANVSRATLVSALGASAFALLLGVLLARTISRPVGELTRATRIIAGGDLGHQVPVRTRDELGELAASFNQMSAGLAQANHWRRQMTADIAHDLRTPMSVILGYTESLSDGRLQGTAELFDIVHQEARHLSHLIEDLRLLSLADAGELPILPRPVPPRALLERVALAHMAQAEEQKVTLEVRAGPELGPVALDPERLTQVLGNLISNALRHTPGGGTISLDAELNTDNWLLITVHDTGTGIAPEDLPHIFNRFFRSDRSRQRNGESGLGLAIARSIVEAHGGTITAESSLGQGTTFILKLPAY